MTDAFTAPSVLVLTTGGTIDKAYFDALSAYQVGETQIGKLLETARVACPHEVRELMRKDSLELNDEDRATIAAAVRDATATHIVITHGTDTMTETARVLGDAGGKTVVFVGALSPARFAESDAPFNLGMAFATAQVAPPGVYITMNGTVFPASSVVKDRARGAFVSR
ncbi:MAG: asparaginase [Sphingomonadales bacterium]|nr:MAG: asparaginase [Sphingomonadales bacterium]TNF01732.1 MAG: asparaginase [Sphingomonadales bacterium]